MCKQTQCLCLVPCQLFIFITFITELKIHHHLFHLSFTTTNSDIAVPFSMQEHVISELSLMASLSISSCSSVDRAHPRCSGDHGFDSRRGLRFFSLCPTPVSCPLFHLYQTQCMYLIQSNHLQTNTVYCSSLVGCRMRNLINI